MTISNAKISSPTARAKLPVSGKPLYIKLATGISLGYRQNSGDGVWVVRTSDGRGGNRVERLGIADRAGLPANGETVLDFLQAQAAALGAKHGKVAAIAMTIGEAIEAYATSKRRPDYDRRNVDRLRSHNPPLDVKVRNLTARHLETWIESLAPKRGKRGQLTAHSINRISSVLKAVLNEAADREKLTDRHAWTFGLRPIDAGARERDRNIILTEDRVRSIIAEARRYGADFGLLVDTLAVTGVRISELARCRVSDLFDGPAPRLMIPTSRKGGRSAKKVAERRVPITEALATRLRVAAAGRPATAALLVKENGEPWRASDHIARFRRVVKAAGQDPKEVTLYALRHTSIVRQLIAGVPIRVVAATHDTSITMIERTYSRHIPDHADAAIRLALPDTEEQLADVVPIRA